MTSLGKALAARKAKASAKVSVDTALQNFSVNDAAISDKFLQEIERPKELNIDEDWAVVDTEKNNIAATNLAGHFLLITEQDIQKKQINKTAKKWGDIKEEKSLSDTQAQQEVVKEKPIPKAPEIYRPSAKYIPHAPHHIASGPKVNIQDNSLFPGLGEPTASNSIVGDEEVEEITKNQVSENTILLEHNIQNPRDNQESSLTQEEQDTAQSQVEEPSKKSVQVIHRESFERCTGDTEILTIDYFLKDIKESVKLLESIPGNDERTNHKYIGRYKRPVISI